MGLRTSLIVVAFCMAAGLGRAGEDLETLKGDLLSLKLRVTPLSREQMAPAGAESGPEREGGIARPDSPPLFPVQPEGVSLGCVGQTVAPASGERLPAWLAGVDQNALFALWDCAWGALQDGTRSVCSASAGAPSAGERLSADQLLGALRIVLGVEPALGRPRRGQTAMVSRPWRF